MSQTQIKSRGNQSIECARMIASFLVVFVHCPFPGRFGKILMTLARFAVPMFFMISGYFSYRVDSKRLAVRVRRMLWLNIMATSIYVLKRYLVESEFSWSLVETFLELAPTRRQLLEWLILSLNPYSEHLWYLAAAFVCYGVLWGYVTFFGEEVVSYRPLYRLCAGLLVLQFILGEMALLVDVEVPYVLCRNALLPGLPLFGIGIFLREYRETLVKNFALKDSRLMAVIFLGVGYSLFERLALGEIEFSLGMIGAVAALVLLLTNHPQISRSRFAEICISKFGFLSASIYFLHQFVAIFYGRLAWTWTVDRFQGAAQVFYPLAVLCITLAASILVERLHFLGKYICKRFQR